MNIQKKESKMKNEKLDETLKEWDKKTIRSNENCDKIKENILSEIKAMKIDSKKAIHKSEHHFIIHKKLVYLGSVAAIICFVFITLFNANTAISPESETILSSQEIAELKAINNEMNILFPNGIDWINNTNNDINVEPAKLANSNSSKIVIRHIVFKKNGNKWDKITTSDIITSTNKEIALDDKKLKGYIWTCQADTNIYAIESQLSIQLENTILKINSSIGLKSEEPQSIKIINQNNSEYKVYQTIVQI